jgi:DNA polymerase-1
MTNPDDLKEIKSKFPHRRQEAKALTFGMAYGQSIMGIAMTFGVSKEVATSIYDTYWASYKGEREFYLKSVDDMVNKGYQINYGNSVILTIGITDDETDKENMSKVRTIYNSIGQSSAHQTLKAMDKAWRRFIKEDVHFRPFLSVYDSIIYSCKDEDAFYVRNVLEEFMLEDLLPDQLFKLSTEFEVGNSYKASHKFGGNEEDCKNTLKELSEY